MAKRKNPSPLDPPSKHTPSPSPPAPSQPPPAPVIHASALSPSPPAPVPSASAQASPKDRNLNGTFAKGHSKAGGIQKGQKQRLSQHIQTQMLELITNEFDSDRFRTALAIVYNEDPAKYLQALQGYMRFCAPTLQSQSLEIQDTHTKSSIDDRLDELMRQH